jgi:hypothetical protein
VVRNDLNGVRRFLIPKGRAFQFQYRVNNGKPQEDTKSLIRRMLTEYASLGGPVYDVQERATEHGTEWHVIPVKARNKGGDLVQQTALLDNIIYVPRENRGALDMLAEICQQLSILWGHRVGLGVAPFTAFISYQAEFGAINQPARDVLADVLDRFTAPLVWQLFYDPDLGWYVLNIHVTPYPSSTSSSTTSSSSAEASGSPALSAVAPPAPRPRGLGYLPPSVLNHARYTPEGISEIQSALARGGYYQGAPSGRWDANTVAAMQKFQSANGLTPTGEPDFTSLQKLGLWPAP